MAIGHDGSPKGRREQFLPEQSLLDLSDYLAIQRAISNETRFRVLSILVDQGAATPTDRD